MVNFKIVIPIILAIVIILGVIIFNSEQVVEEGLEKIQWITSGPFQLEKNQYYLGEKIFITARDIPTNLSGEVIFFRPLGVDNILSAEQLSENKLEGVPIELISKKVKHLGIKFDGEKKQNFNRYFEPKLSEWRGICSTDDLIGEWVMVFYGTQYEPINFIILDEIAPWEKLERFDTLKDIGLC